MIILKLQLYVSVDEIIHVLVIYNLKKKKKNLILLELLVLDINFCCLYIRGKNGNLIDVFD